MNTLTQARAALETVEDLCRQAVRSIAQKSAKDGKLSISKMDEHQVVLYNLVYSMAETAAAKAALDFAEKCGIAETAPSLEEKLAYTFAAEAVYNFQGRYYATPQAMGFDCSVMGARLHTPEIMSFQSKWMDPQTYAQIAQEVKEKGRGGEYGLDADHQMFRETFKKFAEDNVMPIAEKVHRHDMLIPEEIIQSLREMGCFGLSIPQRYGGFQDDDKPDNIGMVVVTEELSRGSLGIAGSLITRPEILSKALLKGGTEEQKQKWLPLLATGERMAGVAVTEPDYGSDVAAMKVAATKTDGGWLINGCKTWCTFAGYADTLMVLVRTNPDLSLGHRGMSILMAEKPRFDGHEFAYTQPEHGGKMTGKAIGTIGYRGMHSYEVHFDNYFVPDENLIGGEAGLGKGFYLQMEGFAGGRLQTAARANGVMQAAFEQALKYAEDRQVFGKPIFDYQITQWKIARMAVLIHAARQFTYSVAHLMDAHKGQTEASLVKLYASHMSEWITREAVQIHGGMGYAEEYAVSRYFVDARVFSLFEGAEETLVLRVVARQVLEEALK